MSSSNSKKKHHTNNGNEPISQFLSQRNDLAAQVHASHSAQYLHVPRTLQLHIASNDSIELNVCLRVGIQSEWRKIEKSDSIPVQLRREKESTAIEKYLHGGDGGGGVATKRNSESHSTTQSSVKQ